MLLLFNITMKEGDIRWADLTKLSMLVNVLQIEVSCIVIYKAFLCQVLQIPHDGVCHALVIFNTNVKSQFKVTLTEVS